MQEVTNVVRSVADIRDVSIGCGETLFDREGTADQIAAAGWLTGEMDNSESVPGTHDFPFSDAKAPLAQVVYLSNVENPRDLQEIVNAVRSIRTYNAASR